MPAGSDIHINGVSMGSSITPTAPVGVHHSPWVSLHAVWTGTPTGTFVVEASNDKVNWVDISAALPLAAPAGSASQSLKYHADNAYAYIRVRYVFTSGTGTLTVTVQQKGF